MSELSIQLHWQRAEAELKPGQHDTTPDPV